MEIPLSLSEISLWLAFNTIILLITSELIVDPHPQAFIDKKRLRLVALSSGIAFIGTVVLHALRI